MSLLKMFPRVLSSRICIIIIIESCVLIFLYLFLCQIRLLPIPPHVEPRQAPFTAGYNSSDFEPNTRCDAFPNSSDVLVVLKTGANEIYTKLPTQLLTMLQCVGNLLILSDLAQKIGPHHVHDVLKNVSEEVKLNNPHFEYYRTLQEYKKSGRDVSALQATTHEAAWNLDKYKFIRMLEESWRMRPGYKWYVFIEADTYLVWSNLLLWLERLDPETFHYLGSPTYANGDSFAHGGSGIIISGAALSKLFERDLDISARYDVLAQNEKYGDYLLMKALKENGIYFSHRWPMLQAEVPSEIPFGPGPHNGVRHWCQPVITMHHVTPEVASNIWSHELQRPDVKQPLLFEELYKHLTSPYIIQKREDWYNLSDDIVFKAPGREGGRQKELRDMPSVEKEAHISFENCGVACDAEPKCFQYVYFDQTCGFSYSYRLGGSREPEAGVRFKSGWNVAKIAKDQADNACGLPVWL